MNAELGVIGSILVQPECLGDVRGILTETDFQTPNGKLFFRTACRMADEGRPIDEITVQTSGLSEEWLAQIVDTTPSAARVLEYARQLKQEARSRTLRAMFSDLSSRAEDPGVTPAELVNEARTGLEAMGTADTGTLISQEDAIERFQAHIESAMNGAVLSVTTGVPSVDEILGKGMVKEGLYIVAARPGVGKTSFGLISAELASRKHRVLFVSLEMSETQIMARRFANISALGITPLLYGMLEPGDGAKLQDALGKIWDRQMTLSTPSGVTVAQIEAMCRSCGADLVVIDYLGLIQSDQPDLTIYEKTTKISGDLKRMARSLKIPVMCLAQLNRASESRADKHPTMADLRDSGAIEQDADGVLLLHRPGVYYDEQPKENDSQPFEIQIAKNRHGPTGTVTLTWYARNGRFQDKKGMNSWM